MKKLFVIAASLLIVAPAFAATYARVTGGQALDVITGASLSAALSGRFVDGYNPSPYWTKVPDTDANGKPLQSGARDDGKGTYTNPPAAVPVMGDAALTKTQLQALITQFGDLPSVLNNWPQVAK